jgi:hypothetical protein
LSNRQKQEEEAGAVRVSLRMDELRARVAAGLDSLDHDEGVDGDVAIDEILSSGSRAS